MSSSSSDDSRISDLDEDPNLVINNSKLRGSPSDFAGRSLKNPSRPVVGSGPKSVPILEKIKTTSKKQDLSSDQDSDFKQGNCLIQGTDYSHCGTNLLIVKKFSQICFHQK